MTLYSLVETAKANNVEPYWYLRALFEQLPRFSAEDDYAACEGFFGRMKNEMYYHQSRQNVSIADFIDEIDTYIRWYNDERIKLTLGGKSPAEYRTSIGLAA